MKIVLASLNEHKVKEINAILKNYIQIEEEIYGEDADCGRLKEIEFISPPEGFDPVENGKTFEDNALIKAYTAWQETKAWTLADDSGLCIDALNGAPGIHSARYAETSEARIDRVLDEMLGIANRAASFKCCMTLINPAGQVVFTFTGVCRGSIIEEKRGVNGFGYDPIFLLKDFNKTMAELTNDEKNRISHRGKALNAVLKYLKNV